MKSNQLARLVLAAMLFMILDWPFKGASQTVQYVTITAATGTLNLFSNTVTGGNNLPVQTNQIVSLVGYDWVSYPTIYGFSQDGTIINLRPFAYSSSTGAIANQSQIPQIFTGLTNICVVTFFGPPTPPGAATFQITTPACPANVVSNYVPADAIVIPASATGNVQIILESSTDLVNWTAANPGTYGASSATNRFFRVRAVHN
jgi:hypothetical protein